MMSFWLFQAWLKQNATPLPFKTGSEFATGTVPRRLGFLRSPGCCHGQLLAGLPQLTKTFAKTGIWSLKNSPWPLPEAAGSLSGPAQPVSCERYAHPAKILWSQTFQYSAGAALLRMPTPCDLPEHALLLQSAAEDVLLASWVIQVGSVLTMRQVGVS